MSTVGLEMELTSPKNLIGDFLENLTFRLDSEKNLFLFRVMEK